MTLRKKLSLVLGLFSLISITDLQAMDPRTKVFVGKKMRSSKGKEEAFDSDLSKKQKKLVVSPGKQGVSEGSKNLAKIRTPKLKSKKTSVMVRPVWGEPIPKEEFDQTKQKLENLLQANFKAFHSLFNTIYPGGSYQYSGDYVEDLKEAQLLKGKFNIISRLVNSVTLSSYRSNEQGKLLIRKQPYQILHQSSD